jgi:hypothetical protein
MADHNVEKIYDTALCKKMFEWYHLQTELTGGFQQFQMRTELVLCIFTVSF